MRVRTAQADVRGADVNATNEDGLTAMHGAAANGADAVVQFLTQKGAKLDVRDKYQQTPLSIATGERLPWIPYGEELGEIIQPSTRDLLLKIGGDTAQHAGLFQAADLRRSDLLAGSTRRARPRHAEIARLPLNPSRPVRREGGCVKP